MAQEGSVRRSDTILPGRDHPIVLGLITAPELSAAVAADLAAELPGRLPRPGDEDHAWKVAVVCDPLTMGDYDNTQLIDLICQRMLREGWDLAVCLTDLPLRSDGRLVVADARAHRHAAVLSLPALGATHLRRRTGAAIVQLVEEVTGKGHMSPQDDGLVDRGAARILGRRVTATAGGSSVRFVLPVVRGHLRLLAGMVRANRPGRLMIGLSKGLTAALGTAALSVINPMIWRLGDQLGVARLSILTLISVALLVGWLIWSHGLWERPSGRDAGARALLYNVATVLTLAFGVLCLYVALFAFLLLMAGFVIDAGILRETLQHHIGIGTYATLSWMTTSAAMVGGALGSGLENNKAVREAAYGYRQKGRTAP